MAHAKKCDVCGKLYAIEKSIHQYHPQSDKDPVRVMTVNFKSGKDSLDLCPLCVHNYLTKMRNSIVDNHLSGDIQI